MTDYTDLARSARGHLDLSENHEAGLIPTATVVMIKALADAIEAQARELAELDFLRHEGGSESIAALEAKAEQFDALQAQLAELRSEAAGYLAVWAVQYAKNISLPPTHLHPTHYDRLRELGARMDDFTRAFAAKHGGV